MKRPKSCFVPTLALVVLLGLLPTGKADIPGITFDATIDPSLGTDAFGLTLLQVNHATHKLYTAGYPSDSTRNFGLKVIDTNSNAVLAGIDLGRYAGHANAFWPIGMTVDESTAPVGDKVYLIGRLDSTINLCLRVIDGPGNTNLTGENTDLFLPVSIDEFTSLAVNSSNHKIYVAQESGDIVVVDGPNRQILRILAPSFGDLVVANPGANKIFVVNDNGGGVINSTDDTLAPLSLFFTATAGVLDSTRNRIYFVGRALSGSNGIFAVDATTGALVGSRTDLATFPLSVTINPDENTLFVGSATDLRAFDAADFTPRGSFARPAARLASDPTGPSGVYFLDDYQAYQQNFVYALNPATGVVANLATAYRPFAFAINNRTNRIYVTDEQTNEILGIDGTNHAVVSRIAIIPPTPQREPALLVRHQRRAAVSERLNRIYLPRQAYDSSLQQPISFVDVFDGATNQFLRSIALDSTIGFYSDLVAIDDTRRRIYVVAVRLVSTFISEKQLVVYDADTETQIATVGLGTTFGNSAYSLAANPVTGRVYASISGLAIVDGNTNTLIGTVGAFGSHIAINRRTNKIYTGGAEVLYVVDGTTDSLETSFPLQNNGDYETAFDVDDVTNRVYVVHAHSSIPPQGRLAAYDANNSYQFLGQIDLAQKPSGLAFSAASRQLFVSHDLDGVVSVFQDATPAPADLFGNISTRAYVADGENVLIGGFIITGTELKTVIVRGIGPSLPVPGALADPVIAVHGPSGQLLGTNDNWRDDENQQQVIDSGFAPASDLESALWGVIGPGAYTVVMRGTSDTAGVGLFEVYDLDRTLPTKLANISTRGQVGSGDNVMIAGVITLGSKPAQVVLRAVGPSLAAAGVANPLEDPVLELRDTNGGLIISNDDWQEHEAEVNGTLLAPTDPRESAIVATLYPATYTAIARGKNGATGVALVEAYYLNQ